MGRRVRQVPAEQVRKVMSYQGGPAPGNGNGYWAGHGPPNPYGAHDPRLQQHPVSYGSQPQYPAPVNHGHTGWWDVWRDLYPFAWSFRRSKGARRIKVCYLVCQFSMGN